LSEATERTCPDEEQDEQVEDPALRRIQEDRLPGEIETGMMTGSDEAGISATERFEGEMTREEALQVLAPDDAETPGPESEDRPNL
jgi:hypothetical protein